MFVHSKAVKSIIIAGAVSLVALIVPAGTASAQTQAPAATADLLAQGAGYVIVNPVGAGVKHVGTRTFYPTGSVSSDTLIVIPGEDGTLPGGITTQQAVRIAAT